MFAPLLIEDEKYNRSFNPKLQSLLTELRAGLKSLVRKQDPSQGGPVKKGDDDYAGNASDTYTVH